MRHCHLIISAVILAVVPMLSLPALGASLWGKVSPEEWSLGAPVKYPEANAVVVFDVCTLTVTIDVIEVKRHVRIKVLTNADLGEVADVSIGYYDGDRIKDLKAQTIKPDGKTFKIDDKQIHVKQSGDYLSKVFSFPAVDSGCILEYSYRNVNERYGHLDSWYFQGDLYTIKSVMTLVLGPGFSYVTAFSNVPSGDRQGVDGQILQAEGPPHKTFTWTRSNLMPVKSEPYMGAVANFLSSIRNQLVSYDNGYAKYKYISNWTDLGVAYQKFLDEYMRGSDLDKLQGQIVAGAASPREKIQRLYQYVSSEIAYKEDPLGFEHTHKNLGQLLTVKSGTGTEKNLLLCALLQKAGLSSFSVLISTRDHVRFNPEIYQVSQFNYTLAYAEFDSSAIFIDAVTKYCPFGMLPSDKLADGGFLIDGKESQLVKILRNEPKSYRYDATDVFIDSSGAARCSTSCSFSGYFAPTWGELREETTAEQFMKDYFSGRIDSTAVIESNEFGIDSLGRCKLDAVYVLKDFVRQLDNNLVVKPISYRFRKNPFTAAKRHFPIDFEFAQTYHNVMVIHSDRAISDATLPPPINHEIAGGSYHREARFENGAIHIDSKLVLTDPAFAASEYSEVKQLFDVIAGAQQDDIVISLAQ